MSAPLPTGLHSGKLRGTTPIGIRQRMNVRNVLPRFYPAAVVALLIVQQRASAATLGAGMPRGVANSSATVSPQPTAPSPIDLWTEIAVKLQGHGEVGFVIVISLCIIGYVLSQAQNIEALLRLLGCERKPAEPDPLTTKHILGKTDLGISFVNSNGENIFHGHNRSGDSGAPNRFIVKVHFKLSIPSPISITNVQLHYPRVKSFPGPQVAIINGIKYCLDRGSFNLQNPVRVEHVADVVVWREFLAESWAISNGDYNEVEVLLEFVPVGLNEFSQLITRGVLAPGGEVVSVEKEIRDSSH